MVDQVRYLEELPSDFYWLPLHFVSSIQPGILERVAAEVLRRLAQ